MHELSIATAIVDRALETATAHGAAEVEELTIELGKATHVNADQLRFCIDTAVEGTIAADATVTIETVSPRAQCDCGWRGEPDALGVAISYAPDVSCPDCGSRVELARGRECRLSSIEIPETGPQAES